MRVVELKREFSSISWIASQARDDDIIWIASRSLAMTGWASLRTPVKQTSWGLARGERVGLGRELADISWIASQARDDG